MGWPEDEKQDAKVLKEVQCSCSQECEHIEGREGSGRKHGRDEGAEEISMVQI